MKSFTNYHFLGDEELGNKCEGQCEREYSDCTYSCSDTNCLLECGRTLTDCVQGISKSVKNERLQLKFQNCSLFLLTSVQKLENLSQNIG